MLWEWLTANHLQITWRLPLAIHMQRLFLGGWRVWFPLIKTHPLVLFILNSDTIPVCQSKDTALDHHATLKRGVNCETPTLYNAFDINGWITFTPALTTMKVSKCHRDWAWTTRDFWHCLLLTMSTWLRSFFYHSPVFPVVNTPPILAQQSLCMFLSHFPETQNLIEATLLSNVIP